MNTNCRDLTCCGDVVELLVYDSKGATHSRNYSLVKIKFNSRFSCDNEWIYAMFIEDDIYPVVFTEDIAEIVLDDPEKGGHWAFNFWLDRYR